MSDVVDEICFLTRFVEFCDERGIVMRCECHIGKDYGGADCTICDGQGFVEGECDDVDTLRLLGAWRRWAAERAGGGMTLQDGDATMRQAIDELLGDARDAQAWRVWATARTGIEDVEDSDWRQAIDVEAQRVEDALEETLRARAWVEKERDVALELAEGVKENVRPCDNQLLKERVEHEAERVRYESDRDSWDEIVVMLRGQLDEAREQIADTEEHRDTALRDIEKTWEQRNAWRTWASDVLGVAPGLSDDELRKRLSAELSRRPEKLGYVLCPDCSPEPDGLVARPGAIIGGRVCCWRCGMAAVAVNESTKGEVGP